jgi:hypothetical protein
MATLLWHKFIWKNFVVGSLQLIRHYPWLPPWPSLVTFETYQLPAEEHFPSFLYCISLFKNPYNLWSLYTFGINFGLNEGEMSSLAEPNMGARHKYTRVLPCALKGSFITPSSAPHAVLVIVPHILALVNQRPICHPFRHYCPPQYGYQDWTLKGCYLYFLIKAVFYGAIM